MFRHVDFTVPWIFPPFCLFVFQMTVKFHCCQNPILQTKLHVDILTCKHCLCPLVKFVCPHICGNSVPTLFHNFLDDLWQFFFNSGRLLLCPVTNSLAMGMTASASAAPYLAPMFISVLATWRNSLAETASKGRISRQHRSTHTSMTLDLTSSGNLLLFRQTQELI